MLGENIYNLRKLKKLSQEQLAESVGVTRQTISNWELGETSPNPEQLKLLSKILHVSIDELLNNDVETVLVEKVSNTEKLAGMIIKILKVIGVLLIAYIVFMIVGVILFAGIRSDKTNQIEYTTEIHCTLNNKEYSYGITYDENNRILEASGDTYLDNILNLEQYEYANQVLDYIRNYFEINNGNCDS